VADAADLDAALGEFLSSGLDVGDGQVGGARRTGRCMVRPTPICTEQADPGGVSCTTRKPLVG
jgi:hypothetical protein